MAEHAIAISYRREDAMDITGRIFDRLAAHYGRDRIFRDIDSMDPGFDFRDKIKKHLDACDILLVIVGPRWIGETAGGRPRIQQDADFVRHEVETGMRKGIPVIPVLVGKASMPSGEDLPESLREFVFRQAVTIDSGRDFDHHVASLMRAMDRILETIPTQQAPPASAEPAPVAAAVMPVVAAVPPREPAVQPAPPAAPHKEGSSALRVESASATVTEQPAGRTRLSNIAKARVVGGMLVVQALLRLGWILYLLSQVGFSQYFQRRAMNSIEVVVLILLAAVVAYGTFKQRRWARPAGLAICFFGIFNEIYYFSLSTGQSVIWNASLIFSLVTFAFGLLVYGFHWPGPKDSKPVGGD
jgi:hypothetical protein